MWCFHQVKRTLFGAAQITTRTLWWWFWCDGGVGTKVERRLSGGDGVEARRGEWHSGLDRSGDEKQFWFTPKKFFGASGGGDVVAAGGGQKWEGGESPMDVKSAFLYGKIDEEIYVCQPPGFEDPEFPDKVYKVEKALYGLHQAPRACQDKYVDENLKKFGFTTVKTTSTPMETSKPLLKDAEAEDVFTPKGSHLHAVKRIFRYLKGQPKLGLWYPKDSPFDLEAYTDSDYVGASLDRKSTTGGCQFLGRRLISWKCKKQTIVVNSTTEAEYVAAASCSDETVIKEWEDRIERAATIASSLEAEQDSGNT
ncbi:ribonuclease H-like domain, reverse transcriptase, RNA-dependent DNA polymerase [Tanacetum coccineum]